VSVEVIVLAKVTAGATVADTEEIAGLVVSGLLVAVQAVVPL
jgi:hypothetical protein